MMSNFIVKELYVDCDRGLNCACKREDVDDDLGSIEALLRLRNEDEMLNGIIR